MIAGIVAAGRPLIAVPETDPYWTDVAHLLHFDGANGSTTITDQKGATWTVTDNAQISTAQSKFGGASLLLDRANDKVTSSAAFAPGSADFTIESWVRPAVLDATEQTILSMADSAGAQSIRIITRTSGLLAQLDIGGVVYSLSGGTTGGALTAAGVWSHVAVVREGGTIRLYKDGVQRASNSTVGAGSLRATTNKPVIGMRGYGTASEAFGGNIDDMRLTDVVCRYPSGTTFAVPASAFPNS